MQRDHTMDLISKAFTTLAALPGWDTDFSGELRCHPGEPALTFRDANSVIGLSLCPRCLRVYLQVAMGIEATGADIQEDRVCSRCSETKPMADFMARSGFPTRFCSNCRVLWGKEKKKQEDAAKAEAAALEEADVKRTLAAVRKDLRRLEAALGAPE